MDKSIAMLLYVFFGLFSVCHFQPTTDGGQPGDLPQGSDKGSTQSWPIDKEKLERLTKELILFIFGCDKGQSDSSERQSNSIEREQEDVKSQSNSIEREQQDEERILESIERKLDPSGRQPDCSKGSDSREFFETLETIINKCEVKDELVKKYLSASIKEYYNYLKLPECKAESSRAEAELSVKKHWSASIKKYYNHLKHPECKAESSRAEAEFIKGLENLEPFFLNQRDEVSDEVQPEIDSSEASDKKLEIIRVADVMDQKMAQHYEVADAITTVTISSEEATLTCIRSETPQKLDERTRLLTTHFLKAFMEFVQQVDTTDDIPYSCYSHIVYDCNFKNPKEVLGKVTIDHQKCHFIIFEKKKFKLWKRVQYSVVYIPDYYQVFIEGKRAVIQGVKKIEFREDIQMHGN